MTTATVEEARTELNESMQRVQQAEEHFASAGTIAWPDVEDARRSSEMAAIRLRHVEEEERLARDAEAERTRTQKEIRLATLHASLQSHVVAYEPYVEGFARLIVDAIEIAVAALEVGKRFDIESAEAKQLEIELGVPAYGHPNTHPAGAGRRAALRIHELIALSGIDLKFDRWERLLLSWIRP